MLSMSTPQAGITIYRVGRGFWQLVQRRGLKRDGEEGQISARVRLVHQRAQVSEETV